MLISFKVSNFLSFNKQVEFSMASGLTRSLSHHVIKVKDRNDLSILKAAIIYGANASGKSNLIKAMDFGRHLITTGTKPHEKIPIKYFKLQDGNDNKLSEFQYDFKYKGKIYSYRFAANNDIVKYESLHEIGKNNEYPLFSRETLKNDSVKVTFSKKNKFTKKDEEFVDFVGRGTRPNLLFLTESIERNVKFYKDVYEWFDKRLNIIFPQSHAEGLENISFTEGKYSKEAFLKPLKELDTNISDICSVETPLLKTGMPEEMVKDIEKRLTKDTIIFASRSDGQRYSIQLNNKNEITARKLCTMHNVKNSKSKIMFDLNEESDGTQRMFDLVPAVTTFSEEDDIFVIDEIDRSLHPHITRRIIQMFLNKLQKKNNQLIVTTHESSLLDLNLIRKDEIWFVAKNKDGESSIYSLEEFKPRSDKDIRKGYLLGRFGAIPIMNKRNFLSKNSKTDETI